MTPTSALAATPEQPRDVQCILDEMGELARNSPHKREILLMREGLLSIRFQVNEKLTLIKRAVDSLARDAGEPRRIGEPW